MRRCYKCKGTEPEVEFKRKDNLCVECFKEYHRAYRAAHKTTIATNDSRRYQANKRIIQDRRNLRRTTLSTEQKRRQISKTPRVFLSGQLSRLRHKAANRKSLHPKYDFDLDLEYVTALWDAQGGKCALSGLPMSHTPRDLFAVSIDRMDSKIGHIKSNVQLVCQCLNMAKGDHSNEELLGFLEAYRHLRS